VHESMILLGLSNEDEIGACSTHGRDEKFIENSGLKIWRVETTRKE